MGFPGAFGRCPGGEFYKGIVFVGVENDGIDFAEAGKECRDVELGEVGGNVAYVEGSCEDFDVCCGDGRVVDGLFVPVGDDGCG